MSTESLPARLVRRTEVLGFVKSNNEVSATDLTILETWNTPEEFCAGFSAIGDVVIQSATNVTDVPFVGSRMIAESCVKQIEEERARHIAKLTASDISTQVLHQIFTAGAGVALPSTHRTIVIF